MAIYSILNEGNGKRTFYVDLYCDGRRIRKAIGANRKEAKDVEAAMKTDILRGEFRFKRYKKILFEDFADEYIEYAKINKRSWIRDKQALKRLLPHFGDLLLSKISPRHIEDYKRERLKEVSPSTVNRELCCLRHMFNVATTLEKFDGENPVRKVKSLQVTEYEWKILKKEETKRLINVASESLKPILIVALNTGMRKGEILNLRWNDVDFSNYFIHLKNTKNNRSRKVPMNSLIAEALKKIKRESEFIFCNPKTKKRLSAVFYPFKQACKRASIEDLRFHDCRHTAGTYMVEGGIDLVTVMQILGHSDIKQTIKYCHPTPENKRRAVNILASVIEQDEREKADMPKSYERSEETITSLDSKN